MCINEQFRMHSRIIEIFMTSQALGLVGILSVEESFGDCVALALPIRVILGGSLHHVSALGLRVED